MDNTNEKITNPSSGWLMLFILLVIIGVAVYAGFEQNIPLLVIMPVLFLIITKGFIVLEPNESRVMTLFGKYVGSIKKDGFFWVNPFYGTRRFSLRARNLETSQIKVNDKMGNPIIIAAIVVWKVKNTFKAAFDVEHFVNFASMQSESAVRKLAGMYAYDSIEDEHAPMTLRDSSEEVNLQLEKEISERLAMAGIEVIESRISHLSYAAEIAGAMLQRQQAIAVVAARTKIVEGAVGMVELALDQLSKKQIVELDEEKKASMVSNLMVVLCSEKSATPVLNTGTLNN